MPRLLQLAANQKARTLPAVTAALFHQAEKCYFLMTFGFPIHLSSNQAGFMDQHFVFGFVLKV